MDQKIIGMTATRFVVQLMTSERTMVEVTLTGTGMRFDERTGTLLSGQVNGLSLSDKVLIGRNFHQDQLRVLSGLQLPADKLADLFGDKDWSHTLRAVEGFDKLIGINHTTSYSYFANNKSEIQGTDFGDHITGSKFGDLMDGRDGDDFFNGAQGNDSLLGGRGNDTLDGGANHDLLLDSEGRNLLMGGSGDDSLRGGVDQDTLQGGVGDDLLYGHGGVDLLAGGKGRDTFIFDFKDVGRAIIQDFQRGDTLVCLSAGTPEEAYKDFMEHARQVGHSAVYAEGEMIVQLNNINLRSLTVESFAGGERYQEFAHL